MRTEFPWGKTSEPVRSDSGPSSDCRQEKLTEWQKRSSTSKRLVTWNVGESMAPWRAQPRATASVAFMVRLMGLPKKPSTALTSAGARLQPPMISTE